MDNARPHTQDARSRVLQTSPSSAELHPLAAIGQPGVEALFCEVKKAYFPRWDHQNEWRVEFAEPALCRDETGYCDSKRRTIFLDEQVCLMPADGVRAFLIHEICHDVAAAGHNLTWARRMERAAKRAVMFNQPEVAAILRSDIYSYCRLDVYHAVVTG